MQQRPAYMLLFVVLVALIAHAHSVEVQTPSTRGLLTDLGVSHSLQHMFTQCSSNDDIFWCFKVQGAKLLGRALKVQSINIVDGMSIVRRADNDSRTGRASGAEAPQLTSRDLESMSAKSLDALLVERFTRFVQSRQLQVNLPRLLVLGQRHARDLWTAAVGFFTQLNDDLDSAGDDTEQGRKKKDDKKYLGPFIAAVMLKAAILKMAYHSIAIIAGKALIVGKIALIISAIIGLKKLVSNEGGEKTTYEIVKHPQVQHSQTYSSSHASEYEGGHESGSYHRSIDDEMMAQDKAYQAWVPTSKVT